MRASLFASTLSKLTVSPFDKVFHVGAIFVAAVVLAPCEVAIEQAGVHGRHFSGLIIFFNAEIARAEETEHRAGSDGRHVTAFLIEPLGITFFWNSVAEKCEAGRAEGDQFVRVYWEIAGIFAAECRFSGPVFEEVAAHPM